MGRPNREGWRRRMTKIFNVEAGMRGNHSTVTAVTDSLCRIGETPIVNMVWRASKKALFEPGDTKWPWKGEAAACFVYVGITSSRTLPTSSVGYWFPFYLVICKHLRGDVILTEAFFCFHGQIQDSSRRFIRTGCEIFRRPALVAGVGSSIFAGAWAREGRRGCQHPGKCPISGQCGAMFAGSSKAQMSIGNPCCGRVC